MTEQAPVLTPAQRIKVEAFGMNESIVHACPPEGSGIMPCCGRTPFEVPMTDRMTVDGEVTCCGNEVGK